MQAHSLANESMTRRSIVDAARSTVEKTKPSIAVDPRAMLGRTRTVAGYRDAEAS
jgi:hypothetical protein